MKKRNMSILCLLVILGCQNKELNHDAINYFPNGNIRSIHARYENSNNPKDILNREITYYTNGQIEILSTKLNNSTNSCAIFWYENGNLQSVGMRKSGKLNGKVYSWYKSGKRKSIYTYKKNITHGKYITWYENGKKRTEGYHYNGHLAGKNIQWHKNGNFQELLLNEDGIGIISMKLFDIDGKLVAKCIYKNNKPWNGNIIKDGNVLPTKYKNGTKIVADITEPVSEI